MTDYLSTGSVSTPTSVNAREPIIWGGWCVYVSLCYSQWLSLPHAASTRQLSYTLGAHVSSIVNRLVMIGF